MDEFGNVQRSADIQAQTTHRVRRLWLSLAIERKRSRVEGGILQPHEDRTRVCGLVAAPIAEAGVLPIVRAAAIVRVACSATTSPATAESAAAATTSAASSKSSATGPLTTAGAGSESSVDAARSKPA